MRGYGGPNPCGVNSTRGARPAGGAAAGRRRRARQLSRRSCVLPSSGLGVARCSLGPRGYTVCNVVVVTFVTYTTIDFDPTLTHEHDGPLLGYRTVRHPSGPNHVDISYYDPRVRACYVAVERERSKLVIVELHVSRYRPVGPILTFCRSTRTRWPVGVPPCGGWAHSVDLPVGTVPCVNIASRAAKVSPDTVVTRHALMRCSCDPRSTTPRW